MPPNLQDLDDVRALIQLYIDGSVARIAYADDKILHHASPFGIEDT